MREFFRGWRRKTGCLLLLMASALLSAWLRSYAVADGAWIPIDRDTQMEIISCNGVACCQSYAVVDFNGSPEPSAKFPSFPKANPGYETLLFVIRTESVSMWRVEYWSVVLPLLALSAWLLIWVPRKRPDRKQAGVYLESAGSGNEIQNLVPRPTSLSHEIVPP